MIIPGMKYLVAGVLVLKGVVVVITRKRYAKNNLSD